MRGQSMGAVRLAVALIACTGVAAVANPAFAAQSYQDDSSSPAASLARNVRTLASDPKDFSALIGAGRAALELGDAQAAAGFFARADEVSPQSPLPQAGMGAVSVANGEPKAALPYFARAQKLGAPTATFGCDRGLAYDLLGNQTQAQADYRAALGSPDGDEARRRLALSLAISGKQAEAMQILAPLLARSDAAAYRTRAFVLALAGDSNGAMTAVDAAMPGSWSRVSPFLQRLPSLTAGQKAAAVNLGIFPDANQPAYAYAAPTPQAVMPTTNGATTVTTDRLTGIDSLLRAQQQPAPPQQVAYAAPVRAATIQRASAPAPTAAQHKVWLQLASGQNAGALPGEFKRMKSRNEDLFDGIKGYLAQSTDRARLVIGPFRGTSDARIFADDLQSVGIAAFSWTNSDSDRIVPLATE
jgi:tetratricopeptide (TPR) repeat protein